MYGNGAVIGMVIIKATASATRKAQQADSIECCAAVPGTLLLLTCGVPIATAVILLAGSTSVASASRGTKNTESQSL